jgi:hypothetical protein
MLRHSSAAMLYAVALATVAGCATSAEVSNPHRNVGSTAVADPAPEPTQPPTETELAAFAARTRYPSELEVRNDLPAAAIVNRNRRLIKIYNFSPEPLHDLNVWVNNSFVHRLEGIAPHGSAVIRTDELYNGMGRNFDSQSQKEVSQVQIETRKGLYNLLGPASE